MQYLFWVIILVLTACVPRYTSTSFPSSSEYAITIFVDARHLNYRNAGAFLKSLQNQPNSQYGRFGHVWIRLEGMENGNKMILEGGHSGERGLANPQYFEGVMNLVDAADPNPIRYLWLTQPDGYFEPGSGHHQATYAATVNLTPEQYWAIRTFIDAQNFTEYSITQGQCASFAAQVALLAGLNLDYEISLDIPQMITFGEREMILWSDPIYSKITFGTPDILEKSLRQQVRAGFAKIYLIER